MLILFENTIIALYKENCETNPCQFKNRQNDFCNIVNMKFGKLDNIEGVDFTLPADYLHNKSTPNETSQSVDTQFYIGCTAWTTKQWKGRTYPEKTKAADYLIAYGKQFNTIELNTTHYSIPKPAYIQKWVDQTPKDFKFCPKVLKYISHASDLSIGTQKINEFCNAVSLFEDKLGMCFIQLPPYFSIERLPVLEQFFKAFPQEIPLAVELRHESFYENGDNLSKTLELIVKYGRTFLITDVAGRRDILHMAMTSDTTMVRFVGNDLHPTDYSRLEEWVSKLNSWTEYGLNKVYFFPHEPDNINAPEISQYFYQRINKFDNFKGRGPRLLEQQKSLF